MLLKAISIDYNGKTLITNNITKFSKLSTVKLNSTELCWARAGTSKYKASNS